MMKTLADLYDGAELLGYYPQCNCGGVGFIELNPDDDFNYRMDDYFVVCSVGAKKHIIVTVKSITVGAENMYFIGD